ncbi:MAG TPA: N-acetylmuramoyl-L-alanine amidase [Rhodospirillales bacterium]|nr:N-acetylmuramoyl-L-alanine amidase [Rhodospirillales bacterium]
MLRYWCSFRWIFLILAATLCLGSAPVRALGAPLEAKTVITDMRVGLHGKKTRFVFVLTKQTPFDVFTLANPYRVVIDLPEVGWRLPARPLPQRTGLLSKLRYGLFKQGVSRVVLDINGPAAIDAAFMLDPSNREGHRIVIDLAKTSRQAFLRNMRGNTVRVVTSTPGGAGAIQVPRARVAAAPQPSLAPSLAPPRKPRRPGPRRVIAIDPGHGGVDPGATGASGIHEKHINLIAAREIKRKLEATGRFRVVMTRKSDVFIRLRDRVAIARNASAELFISIHADAIKNRSTRGLSVYTLSERASDKEAAALAEKENKADLIAGINLNGESAEVTNILIELAQRETMNQSALFASTLVKRLRRQAKVLRKSHRFAGFAVLKAPDIPSVLLELGFLSNRNEERALRSRKYRAKLFTALTYAVKDYFTDVEQASRR